MTNGTGSPEKSVFLSSSAIRMPQTTPSAYSPIITSAMCSGKKTALKNA